MQQWHGSSPSRVSGCPVRKIGLRSNCNPNFLFPHQTRAFNIAVLCQVTTVQSFPPPPKKPFSARFRALRRLSSSQPTRRCFLLLFLHLPQRPKFPYPFSSFLQPFLYITSETTRPQKPRKENKSLQNRWPKIFEGEQKPKERTHQSPQKPQKYTPPQSPG